MSKKTKIVPGMQVRVARAYYHGLKFGAVCRVVEDHLDGDVSVIGPVRWSDETYLGLQTQAVCKSLCKPIKRKG